MAKVEELQSYEEAFAILAGLANLASIVPAPAETSHGVRLDVDRDSSKLHIAEARYRALVEQIPAVTFIASLVGGISEIYVSPQIETLLGYTQEQWISDPVLWFHQLHPDDRPILTRAFAEACSTGQPLRGMCRAYARDGRMVWVHGEARFVRDDHGRPLFLQGIAFDVTEQQQAIETRALLLHEQTKRVEADRERARIEHLFEGLPAAVMILRGPNHVIEFLNQLARDVSGNAVRSLIGKPFGEAFPGGASQIAVFDEVYATGRAVEAKEWAATSSDWEGERYFHYVAQPLIDDAGAVAGVLTHTVEVTEQVRARCERERVVDELQRTLRYNEIFAGMLGHDLRNPLGAIMSGAQLALRRGPPDGIRTPLTRILSASDRMSRMIDQLLDFTRIRVGRGIELQPAQVSLEELCQRVIEEIEVANPDWTLQLQSIGDATGCWDADRLLQVISNLVSNGVKHGDRSVPLTVRIDGRQPHTVMLLVHNHGSIPTELMSTLFDPFRGSEHRRDRARGLGLGLYITEQIVLAHHGTVQVSSNAEGTTFTVALPRQVDGAGYKPLEVAAP